MSGLAYAISLALDRAVCRDEADDWLALQGALAEGLGQRNRSRLALMAMMALPEDIRADLAKSACKGGPEPGLFTTKDDAELWAAAASPEELRAYVWAGFQKMPADMKERFRKAAKCNGEVKT